MAVREIKGWSEITPLPEQPEYMRGVIDLRGVTVPILDLRCRFGQGLTEPTSRHVIVVVDIASRLVGLLADQVLDIISANAAQIQPVPRIAGGTEDHVLSGLVTIDGAMTALIDLANLLVAPRSDASMTAEAATQH
jgi:purine-binding chemotaxis protein CheW